MVISYPYEEEKSMYIQDRNIYKTARKSAGMTQEAAAERLGISVESIRAYETGVRVPPVDVVDLMVICYDSQAVGIQHLRAISAMSREILPDVPQVRLPEAAMQLIDRIYAFADKHLDRELISIAKDGVIDENERDSFDAIAAELEGIVQAAMALRCAQGK